MPKESKTKSKREAENDGEAMYLGKLDNMDSIIISYRLFLTCLKLKYTHYVNSMLCEYVLKMCVIDLLLSRSEKVT